MTPGPPSDPILVPCPTCEAGVRERCFVPRTGRELPKPHAKRAKLAADQAASARRRADGDAKERLAEPRWRRLYAACRLELEGRGDWTTLASEELEAMVMSMRDAAAAREQAAGKLTVQGSTGQPVANPNLATATRLDAQALAFARSLKLTPDTRGTSAPRPGDEDVPAEADVPEVERDELAALDELAAKRKAKGRGKAAGGTRRRGG